MPAADILALDIPSGLHADTGPILGTVIHAAATLTFIGLKQGLFTGQDRHVAAKSVLRISTLPPDIYPALHPRLLWRYD
ncbi:MAG: NAD(P)H-hydrate epimerase [Candidatus Competibacteraceae bacterium]